MVVQFVGLAYHARISGDASLYFAVGRGILNGLKPYVDLYESKPPAIFLLSALSLWLTGGILLYSLAYIVAIAGIPASLVWFTWRISRENDRLLRIILVLLSLLYGCAVSLYAMGMSSFVQTEAFGSFLGILYVLTLANSAGTLSMRRMCIAASCMLGAIGFKEPFVFSLLASALILAETNRSMVRSFVIPLMLAVTLGVVFMALLGYLRPYVTIYLPDILSSRLPTTTTYKWYEQFAVTNVHNPLWVRGFSFMALIGSIYWDSLVPMIAFALMLVWSVRPLFRRASVRRVAALLCVAGVAGGAWLLYRAWLYLQLLEILKFHFPWSNAFFVSLTWQMGAAVVIWIGVLALLIWMDRVGFGMVIRSVAAIYVGTLAIAITGEYSRHLVFAVPVVVAPFVVLIRGVSLHPVNTSRIVVIALLTALLITLPFIGRDKATYAMTEIAQKQVDAVSDRDRQSAERLDAMMDNCGYTRFFLLGRYAEVLAGYTRHSPYQILYGEIRAFDEQPSSYLRTKFFADLAKTPVVVSGVPDFLHADSEKMPRSMLDPIVRSAVAGDFTLAPPACAKEFLPLDTTMSVYFRKGPGNVRVEATGVGPSE